MIVTGPAYYGPKYQAWLQRLRAGTLGEREDQPSTWVFDDVWRAACEELTSYEHREVLKRDKKETQAYRRLIDELRRDLKGTA